MCIRDRSKAAAAFHPGQGVYRSSYKNAMRLTRSEINMAYRESERLRWANLDFVVGFEIRLSNNHTTTDPKTGKKVPFVDICDTLAGRYPKSFVFKGCLLYTSHDKWRMFVFVSVEWRETVHFMLEAFNQRTSFNSSIWERLVVGSFRQYSTPGLDRRIKNRFQSTFNQRKGPFNFYQR